MPKELYIEYFSGERETLKPADLNTAALKAKPRELRLDWAIGGDNFSAYFYVPYETALDNKAVAEAYKKVSGGDKEPVIDYVIEIAREDDGFVWEVGLRNKNLNEEILLESYIFKNGAAFARSDNFYQPQSRWDHKRTKPQKP